MAARDTKLDVVVVDHGRLNPGPIQIGTRAGSGTAGGGASVETVMLEV